MTQTKIKTQGKTCFYFTFGAGQLLADHFIAIWAKDPIAAREAVIKQFGQCWSFQYELGRPEAEWISREYEAGRLKKIGPVEV